MLNNLHPLLPRAADFGKEDAANISHANSTPSGRISLTLS